MDMSVSPVLLVDRVVQTRQDATEQQVQIEVLKRRCTCRSPPRRRC